jgi:hypothetical protein
MSNLPLYLGLAAGILAAAFAGFLVQRIDKLPAGNARCKRSQPRSRKAQWPT